MSLQLIFVVETNNKSKSDSMYITEIINHFYKTDNVNLKISFVYMEGKANYNKRERKINELAREYSHGNNDRVSKVIYCIDTDDYDHNIEDCNLNTSISDYCKLKGYELAWFCKDIERVLVGSKIDDHEKKKMAADFKRKQLINRIMSKTLSANHYKNNTSNILNILDKYAPYLIRKEHE